MGKKTASTSVRVTERVAFAKPHTVRRGGAYPVIENVLLCGAESANRRRYKPSAFGKPEDKRYEGKPVFLDHTDERTGRKYRDQIGWVETERRTATGLPVGDIGIKPTHELAESVCWDAEHRPQNAGMSHVAKCQTARGQDGWEVVESVDEVESVDIVINPATTKSFYENKQGGRAVTTFREVLESLRAKLPAERQPAARKLLLLAEDDAAMGGVMDAPIDAPAADADPDDAITAGVRSIVLSIVDDKSLSADEKLKKIRLALQMHDKLNGTGTSSDSSSDTTGSTDTTTPESRKPLDSATVLAECKAKNFAPSYEQGEHLRNIPDAGTRAVVIESFKAATAGRAGERVSVAGRHEADRAAGKDKDKDKRTTEAKDPGITDGKSLVRAIAG